MADATTVRLTAPAAAELLRTVHRVRDRLDADLPLQRHLTQALASAAGVPSEAARWDPDSPLPAEEVMAGVLEAIRTGRALTVEHLQQDGQVRDLTLEPYHVRLESRFWYLLSRIADTGKERVLRLDKVLTAALGERFEPRPPDLDQYLTGVFVPADPGAVAVVRFGARSSTYAAERWGDGKLLADGGVEIEIPYHREHFLVRTLAEFGDDYEVVSPAGLREGVRARAAATLAVYAEEPAAQ